jgi:hypothetical protein
MVTNKTRVFEKGAQVARNYTKKQRAKFRGFYLIILIPNLLLLKRFFEKVAGMHLVAFVCSRNNLFVGRIDLARS